MGKITRQELSSGVISELDRAAKTEYITVTQEVDLDDMESDIATNTSDITDLENELALHKDDYATPHKYEDEGTDPEFAGVKYRLVVIDGEAFMEVVEVEE